MSEADMKARPNTVPVTIVTGFLGSGKTTMLNRLLKRPELADTVVIVNEFGEVGLDHLLIEQAIENTVLLKNGCICCTVRGDVADTLELLWQQRASGVIPSFSRIVIETTGLADPGSVAHALIAEPGAGYACRLDGIVTTLDALHGAQQMRQREEVQRQVTLADVVLVTKTDLVPADALARLERDVAGWNPHAPIRHVTDGEVNDTDIFGLSPNGDVSGEQVARWLNPGGAHAHHHFHHDEEIASVLLTHAAPIEWERLRYWLDSVLSLRGAEIMRIKGLVDIAGETAPVVLQVVHHVVHPVTRLPAWPTAQRATQLVVIHQGLPRAGLQASFAAAIDTAAA